MTTLNKKNRRSAKPSSLDATEAFIILNDKIFYGYGFKNLGTGNIPIHVETFLMLNLVKAIATGKIQGVNSITIYSTLQPCCMCSLIIHQSIMYLRGRGHDSLSCNIFYGKQDGLMKVPGTIDRPSYWDYVDQPLNERQRREKTALINWDCLVEGQTRSGLANYTLQQMFERQRPDGGKAVPTENAMNLIKAKSFHSEGTKNLLVETYLPHRGEEIWVRRVPYSGTELDEKGDLLGRLGSNSQTLKLIQIIDYFYFNASSNSSEYGFHRFGMNGGTYNIISARKVKTFLSGFTLLNAAPDCGERGETRMKTASPGMSAPALMRACSMPTYQVNNLIVGSIDLSDIPDQSQKGSVGKAGMSAEDALAGMGGYKKTKRKRKKRRNKKTIKKKRKKSRKTRKTRKLRKRRRTRRK